MSSSNLKPVMCTTERGVSLVELLVFIVVIGIAVGGMLAVFGQSARTSADPMIDKQARAIAESLLAEVLGRPFTYCDPDDANADSATSPAGCASQPEGMGPEPGETRYSGVTPFDNVNDYAGFAMNGITDAVGSPVADLAAYAARVAVTDAGAWNGLPAGETLLVTVTVDGPANHRVVLSGYRTRHAPNL
jgi:MSHA pilin protein MshD